MARKKPKLGYVYLLENIAHSEHRIYKFGCTSLTPAKRCKRVNYEQAQYGFEFKVIAAFKSFDIYTDEHQVRLKILDCGAGVLSEVFLVNVTDELPETIDVMNRFLTIGNVIGEGVK
jgi:hypothetical protein